jgi:hypothetical protein
MAIGVPGWPELACCTASIERVRIVLMQVWSSWAFVTMVHRLVVYSWRVTSAVFIDYFGLFDRRLERRRQWDSTEYPVQS